MAIFNKKSNKQAPKGHVSEPTIKETVKDQNEIVFDKMNIRERESVKGYIEAERLNKIALKQSESVKPKKVLV